MSEEFIKLSHHAGGVAELRLTNGPKRNPLSSEVLSHMGQLLDQVAEDQTVGALIISHDGPAFSAGHDLKELRANRDDSQFVADLFAQCSVVMKKIVRLPKPVIALVDGIATAAGCQMVSSCDLAFASKAAEFGTPGVKIGLFCSTPMVALSRKVGRNTAMEMLLTGRHLGADEAAEKGLINSVVDADQLHDHGLQVASLIASYSHNTLAHWQRGLLPPN
jgi:Enoyl-CoA hydratase/carnithine racemase